MSNLKKLIKDHWIKPFIIIGLFLACLSISILMKKWFDLDGDYLSAFATLMASYIVLILYTSWETQHNKSTEKDIINSINNYFFVADASFFKFQYQLDDFQEKYVNLQNLSEDDFQSLSSIYKTAIYSLRDVHLNFEIYRESLRKYCLKPNQKYYEIAQPHLTTLQSSILNIQSRGSEMPSTMDEFDQLSRQVQVIKNSIECLDSEVNEILLTLIWA